MVTDARTGCCAALLYETKHTTETLIRFVLSFIYETRRTNTPIQTDDEEATKALARAVSRRIGIPPFTSPAYSSGSLGHTERFILTLGTTSNLTNTDGRQIFEVADPNNSSDCRLGHSTCFLDSDTILATCRRENFIRTTMATTLRISIVHLWRNGYVCRTDEGLTRNTPYDSTQASGLDDARFRMRIWLWMVASCFEPDQYDDCQKDQNDEITKQCNDLQLMLPIRLRFLTFRRGGEMCRNMTS